MMTSAALALACVAVVYASTVPALLPAPDLGSQLMRQVFGESSDASASFAAAAGDRASESPLRELAFEGRSGSSIAGVAFEVGSIRRPRKGATGRRVRLPKRSFRRTRSTPATHAGHFAAPSPAHDVTPLPP